LAAKPRDGATDEDRQRRILIRRERACGELAWI